MPRNSWVEVRAKAWVKAVRWLYRTWRSPLRRIALISGVLCVLCLALMEGPPQFTGASMPQRFGSSVLEVEFLRDVEDLRLTLGDAPSLDRETMRLKTHIDFAFIASYVAFLGSLGLLLARRGGWRRWTGIGAILCATGAGVFDVLENRAILAIIETKIAATTPAMLDAIRQPSTVKWSLAALCVALLLSFYEPTTRSEVSNPVRSDSGGARRARD